MSTATLHRTQERITNVIPLEEQITTIKEKVAQYELMVKILAKIPKHRSESAKYEAKINFWSNVLRSLEILKRKSR